MDLDHPTETLLRPNWNEELLDLNLLDRKLPYQDVERWYWNCKGPTMFQWEDPACLTKFLCWYVPLNWKFTQTCLKTKRTREDAILKRQGTCFIPSFSKANCELLRRGQSGMLRLSPSRKNPWIFLYRNRVTMHESGIPGSGALWWLIACDALRVSACDAQLASYTQRTPSFRGPASRPLEWASDQKFNFCSLNFAWSTCAHVRASWALATRIMEAVWRMMPVPFQVEDPVRRGTFGTRCGERKENAFDRGGITWLCKTACYPPWNQQLAPEDGWLEYDRFLLGWPIFRNYVSFRECTLFVWSCCLKQSHQTFFYCGF